MLIGRYLLVIRHCRYNRQDWNYQPQHHDKMGIIAGGKYNACTLPAETDRVYGVFMHKNSIIVGTNDRVVCSTHTIGGDVSSYIARMASSRRTQRVPHTIRRQCGMVGTIGFNSVRTTEIELEKSTIVSTLLLGHIYDSRIAICCSPDALVRMHGQLSP